MERRSRPVVPFAHDRVARSDFPFPVRGRKLGGVISSPPQRVADLRLRSSSGPMRTRVWWPASQEPGVSTGLLLFFVDAALGEQEWLRELATAAQVVVVAAPCDRDPASLIVARLRDGMAALEWAAEHAGQLEAVPDRLFVGGIRLGAALANAAAAEAANGEWPRITRQLLIPLDVPCPELPGPPGMAPAVTFDEGDLDVGELARSLRG
jgi:hypothetical protein